MGISVRLLSEPDWDFVCTQTHNRPTWNSTQLFITAHFQRVPPEEGINKLLLGTVCLKDPRRAAFGNDLTVHFYPYYSKICENTRHSL